MKKSIRSIIIFILIAGVAGKFAAASTFSEEPSKEQIADALIISAKYLNAQTPIQVDEKTKMTSVVALPSGLMFLYSVSLNFRDYDDNELFSSIRANNLDAVCKNSSFLKVFTDNNLYLAYMYKDIYGNSLPIITMDPKHDCKSSSYK